MGFMYDISVNLLASAIWALAGLGYLYFKKNPIPTFLRRTCEYLTPSKLDSTYFKKNLFFSTILISR